MEPEGVGDEQQAVPWEVGVGCTWELTQSFSHRDVILFAIDCGASMHESHDGDVPLLIALRAAARLMEVKLVSSPKDHVGVLFWNTSKGGYRPHTYEYASIKQVDVPTTYVLKQLIEVLHERFAPAEPPMSIEAVLINVVNLISTSAKAGTRRVFYVTNQDQPSGSKAAQKACIEKIKVRLIFALRNTQDYYRRGVDLEPFFMSSQAHRFDINLFYAEILGVYDDGLVDDKLRPWRLRQLQDQNVSKRAAWDSAEKMAELEDQMGGREVPKRVNYDLIFDLGSLSKMDGDHGKAHRASRWRIQVKAYSLVHEATRDLPVRVTSYGNEDSNDLYEVTAVQQMYSLSSDERIQPDDVTNVFQMGADDDERAQVSLSDEEIKALREFGCVPGLVLLGFKNRSTLHFYENIKHAYFLYPSDLEHPGSKCVFAAMLQSMLAKNKMALVIFMPRENVIPSFAVLLPQAEELDEAGNQVCPPGMNMIIMPYADDIRSPPEMHMKMANKEEVTAAVRLIDTFHRRDPFNPDVFPNPVLRYHYDQLMAQAFGAPTPAFEDSVLPDFPLINRRSSDAIATWRATVESDGRATGDESEVRFGAAEEKELRELHRKGQLNQVRSHAMLTQILVSQLRLACEYFGLPKHGRKAELIETLGNYLQT